MLTVDIVEQHGAITHVGVSVSGSLISHLVGVNLRINIASTVVVCSVASIAVIHFIEIHSGWLHVAVAGVNAILNRTPIFKEEHRLHILCTLIDGGEIVGERGVCHSRLQRHIAIGVLLPYLLPSRYFRIVA